MPIFHALEDIILQDSINLYFPEKVYLKVKDYSSKIYDVGVLVHDPRKILKSNDYDIFLNSVTPCSYQKVNIGYTFCSIIDNQELFKIYKQKFSNGYFRYKK